MSQKSSTPEKIQKSKTQWAHIRRTYGLTEEQYHELDLGHCPICLRGWSATVRPCVDHDHSNGNIRGVVCLYCNHRIIGRHRDASLIFRLAAYLDTPKRGWLVPKKKKKRRAKK